MSVSVYVIIINKMSSWHVSLSDQLKGQGTWANKLLQLRNLCSQHYHVHNLLYDFQCFMIASGCKFNACRFHFFRRLFGSDVFYFNGLASTISICYSKRSRLMKSSIFKFVDSFQSICTVKDMDKPASLIWYQSVWNAVIGFWLTRVKPHNAS